MKIRLYLTAILLGLFVTSLFSQNKVFSYLSPLPGSKYHNQTTSIIIKSGFIPEKKLVEENNLISIYATKSGFHKANQILSADRQTIIFKPSVPFVLSDTVFVKVSGKLTNNSKDYKFFFIIKSEEVTGFDYNRYETGNEGAISDNQRQYGYQNRNVMPMVFPTITITVSTSPSPGYIFLDSWRAGMYDPYLIILNNSGNVIFSRMTQNNTNDFKMHPDGKFTYYEYGKNMFFLLNESYAIKDSFYCGNGYSTDGHDIVRLDDGSVYLIGLDPQIVDMSLIVPGGNPQATVIGNIIQQIDSNKNVIFEWRSWDNIQITDATRISLLSSEIDYMHCNAIEKDYDNNILISSRHTEEITKINRSTGKIIWRFGGKNNQITVTNDTVAFSYQHDIRRLPNKNITIFDNGNYHPIEIPTRVLEYQLNENGKTAELVWSYSRPSTFSIAMGNAQRLNNGNTFIGWGNAGSPTLTEIKNTGEIVFELKLPTNVYSYRAYRFNMTSTNLIEGSNPVNYELKQNFPNPFNPVTKIEFSILKPGMVNLEVFGITGKKAATVINKYLDAGSYCYIFDGTGLSSGIYFYRIQTKDFSRTMKMILIK